MGQEAAGERALETCVLIDASFQRALPTEPIFVPVGLNGPLLRAPTALQRFRTGL